MACVCKDNDGKRSESRDRTCPLEHTNCASVFKGIAFDIMRDNQDNKVGNGEKGDDACVLERIQTTKEG